MRDPALTHGVNGSSAPRRTLRRTLLVMLAATSLVIADEALARRAKSSSPGNPAARTARAAAALAAQPAAVPVDGIKPIPNPRRHGNKGRPASR